MILAGDVGGTKTRIALVEPQGQDFRIAAEETYPSAAFGSLLEVLHAFRNAHAQRFERAGFGVAGPVRDGVARLTHLAWTVTADEIARDLALESVAVVNDLEATAQGIAALGRDDLVCLSPGSPEAKGNRAVIAAGTGLGQAGLFWNGREHVPFGSEGGHADFAPAGDEQEELLHFLRREMERVGVEDVLSGPGLHRIYRFQRDAAGGDEPEWLADELARGDPPAAISRAAMEGRSKLCEDALDLFVSVYGSQAGNFALSVMATGGVYVGGGIAPRILAKLRGPTFLRAFESKGALTDVLRSIPVHVIVDERAAIYGAARAASTPPAIRVGARGRTIRVRESPEALARAACEEIVAQALAAIGVRGRFTLALAGGSTPRLLHAELAVSGLPWDKVQLFFGDERCVPPEHPGSNYRMARETLLARIPIPAANVHRMPGELPAPGRAAIEYEAELRRSFGLRVGEIPRFDVVILGMGADGHVASLFPGTSALDERERLVVATWVEKAGAHRITLTLPVLNEARCVLFLVSGRDKAETLRAVLSSAPAKSRIPARLVEPREGRVVWMLDREAAALLEERPAGV